MREELQSEFSGSLSGGAVAREYAIDLDMLPQSGERLVVQVAQDSLRHRAGARAATVRTARFIVRRGMEVRHREGERGDESCDDEQAPHACTVSGGKDHVKV